MEVVVVVIVVAVYVVVCSGIVMWYVAVVVSSSSTGRSSCGVYIGSCAGAREQCGVQGVLLMVLLHGGGGYHTHVSGQHKRSSVRGVSYVG